VSVRFSYQLPEFLIDRDLQRCIRCKVCVRQCAFEAHIYDEASDVVIADSNKCVGCLRCVTMCPTDALIVRQNPTSFKENANWTGRIIKNIYKQAETGGVLLTGMGNDRPYPIYWDHIVLNASQVTNPSIDPLREPMELKTYLGSKPERLDVGRKDGKVTLNTKLAPQLEVRLPILFPALTYGAIRFNASTPLASAAY